MPGRKPPMPSEAERTRAERDRIAEPEPELVDAAVELVDAGSELSFPASDPPSYMGGTAVAGGPPPDDVVREGPSTALEPDAAEPARRPAGGKRAAKPK